MDQSFSGSDASMSPGQILERLQALRQLQLLQRGKLQKQRLKYCQASGDGNAVHDLISQLSTNTSYNTFQQLLAVDSSYQNVETDESSRITSKSQNTSKQISSKDLMEGVSILNLSQESEFIIYSPVSSGSRASSKLQSVRQSTLEDSNRSKTSSTSGMKKQISLDEMPILSPRQDFETLLLEKLQTEKKEVEKSKVSKAALKTKQPFLRRGEGLARFGMRQEDLVIENTKSLPWKKRNARFRKFNKSTKESLQTKPTAVKTNDLHVKFVISKDEGVKLKDQVMPEPTNIAAQKSASDQQHISNELGQRKPVDRNTSIQTSSTTSSNSSKSWATILTQEQDTFLRQLKQSQYYKNYESPSKSVISDTSTDDHMFQVQHDRETAEQKVFELLESKVSRDSFNSDSNFFRKLFKNKFLPECSGENTPLTLQKCLAKNPELLQLFPAPARRTQCQEDTTSDFETCDSEYVDCDHETCSSVSSCCTCKTVEESQGTIHTSTPQVQEVDRCVKKSKENPKKKSDEEHNIKESHLDNTVTDQNEMKANMAEMNAKLVATSDLLKERLHELEDEIEMFRKENANLSKMREDIEVERQKFYCEKADFEQKYNEEKILGEYYLAEEKEKLAKQKQIYDRYVREMRGRLNKKDKDEVITLKKEIEELKEEIRLKDAKTTSCIARLRNHIKVLEKEKKGLQDDCENLKKENRRIQRTNTTTRRLSNVKCLAEINRKLSLIGVRETQSDIHIDDDMKYMSQEITSRGRVTNKPQAPGKNRLRVRAKSVPNLNVTSRYAKYFSQRDANSQIENDIYPEFEIDDAHSEKSDEDVFYDIKDCSAKYNNHDSDMLKLQEGVTKTVDKSMNDNNLEKIYQETFLNKSPDNRRLSLPVTANSSNESPWHSRLTTTDKYQAAHDEDYFLRKSPISSISSQKSKTSFSTSNKRNDSTSAPSCHNETVLNQNSHRSKSPISILSNRSSNGSRKSPVNHEIPNFHDSGFDVLSSRLNPNNDSRDSIARTNLNPTEIKRPDGTRELRFPNGNVKSISADGKYSRFAYYNGDVKETFYDEGRVKYFYAETKTCHSTYVDGLEILEFPDGQIEKRYKDGSMEIRLPNGSVRYTDPKNEHVSEEWRFPDGTVLTVASSGEQVVRFANGQVEIHAKDHKRREFPDGTVKLVYSDGTSETRYSSGRVRVKDRHGTLIMDSATSG